MSDIIRRYLYTHKKEVISMTSDKMSFLSRLNYIVNTFGDNIAILYEENSIRYSQLDQMANSVANYLLNLNMPAGSIVAVDIKNRLNLIIAILGIVKAGFIFAPFDDGFNLQKKIDTISEYGINYIISDSSENFNKMPHVTTISFSIIMKNINVTPPIASQSNNDGLYLYFTSGTTGCPKAILGLTKSLLHFIDWEIQTFDITEKFRVAQFTNPMFDPFLRDIFVPLFSGATLCIPAEPDLILDSRRLLEWISFKKISLIHTVPSVLYTMIQEDLYTDITDLKYIFLAGEGIDVNKLKRWYELHDKTTIINLYGPTETTLAKCYHIISAKDLNRIRIPVGKAINDTNIYVLKEGMIECDPFEIGEVYINTDYASAGYYKRDILNKECFLHDHSYPYSTLYKTGDLGKKLDDGSLELLGRIDRQVKIRGVRVELSEIEYLINSEFNVDETIALPDEENQTVVLYIKPYNNIQPPSENEILTFLSQRLVKQSVPSKIIYISSVPRKVNGKIEYTELRKLANHQQNIDTLNEDLGDIGNKLLKLWRKILNVSNISSTDNFFHLGGHSLNLMSLMREIEETFDVTIPLATLFKHPTIAEQMKILTKDTK